MKINIYYGGRGLIEDPTLYTMNKFIEVLKELRVEVDRFNLYEYKNNEILTLPHTINEADGVILAVSVEWLGIGGLMQQFLDACWLYGDKEKISKIYMMPAVLATTYGEREAQMTLTTAWETLGGIPCDGLCAYVEDHVEFETNTDYSQVIERKAETLYRTIKQNIRQLPTSNSAVKRNILRTSSIVLTPQESEQLSRFVSDDSYVKKQKEDIEQLSQLFKGMLGQKERTPKTEFIQELESNFHPQPDFIGTFVIQITDRNKSLVVDVSNEEVNCYYGERENADVVAKTTHDVLLKIVGGRMTFQRAFMSGEVTAKGDFKVLRIFDTLFQFAKDNL